jgi:hypothetical protein
LIDVCSRRLYPPSSLGHWTLRQLIGSSNRSATASAGKQLLLSSVPQNGYKRRSGRRSRGCFHGLGTHCQGSAPVQH